MKSNNSLKWIVRLAVLFAAAWLLQPLYRSYPPTPPRTRGADDYVRWTYHDSPNEAVVQRFTIYGNGRNVLELYREIGDPDMPEVIQGWKVRRDKDTGLTHFARENVLPSERSVPLLNEAVKEGVIDLKPVKTKSTEQLEIERSFDGNVATARGPRDLSSTFDWTPDVWVNRKRWQKVARIPAGISEVAPQLEKRSFILTDDAGNPLPAEQQPGK